MFIFITMFSHSMLHIYHNPHCKLEEPNRVTILKQILKNRPFPSCVSIWCANTYEKYRLDQ